MAVRVGWWLMGLPSAEAIEAMTEHRIEHPNAPLHRFSDVNEFREVASLVLAIDAPAIAREAHAAGVAEGRAAMLREVVAWARLMAIESPVYLAAEWNRFADAIEARFPSEGDNS